MAQAMLNTESSQSVSGMSESESQSVIRGKYKNYTNSFKLSLIKENKTDGTILEETTYNGDIVDDGEISLKRKRASERISNKRRKL